MSELLSGFLVICFVLVLLLILGVFVTMLIAIFVGLYKGVKQLNGRDVQIQDNSLPPPVRGTEVSD